MSAKELKDRLKELRNTHAGKPITKMTAEEMEREISHHETAQKAVELKAKRLEALAKAREAKKGPPTLVVKKAPVTKSPRSEAEPSKKTASKPTIKTIKTSKKKADEYSEASSTDHDSEDSDNHETIKKRIQKKD